MMSLVATASERRRAARLRLTLRRKLLIGVVAISLLMLAFLLGYFGPHTERSFLDRSNPLIGHSADALRDMARSHSTSSQEIVTELIRHSADARRRALEDMPLSLYGGDVERIRATIAKYDADRAERRLRNVEVLGRELERRSRTEIDRHVRELTRDQEVMSAEFGADLRASYVMLSGGALALLIILLGLGLDQFIVRPLQRLRHVTRVIAAGDLSVQIETRSGDELGDLAGDLSIMVQQLRASRDAISENNDLLERWNENLQREVQRKTRHLGDALENLQAAQRELLHADKMASIGTLAGGIGHEFNNLIGGIRGCITDALRDDASAQRREPLEVALRATDRAAAITERLLKFARPRIQGRQHLPLDSLIVEVIDLVEPQARRQSVSVETRMDAGLTAFVDAGELHQVFLNLFTNALQAMPDGGKLEIEARRSGDRVVVCVIDTGTGISTEEIEHVFDPFYTSKSNAHDPAQRGSGLGLSVSYGIVEAHGGLLSVASTPGQGSTFSVSLPIHGPGSTDP